MPRKARKLSSTKIYHVVIKGADRQLLFEEEKDYRKYLDILAYYKKECGYQIFAYCLMSNHVHLLLHTNTHPIDSIFRKINTRYAVWFNLKYQRTGFVQNGRFYSEPVETTSYFLTALHYIHYNPTKAGLESHPGEKYVWSSFYDYIHDSSSLTDTEYLFHLLPSRDAFYKLHQIEPTQDCLEIIPLRKIPDDVAKDIIEEISHCQNATEFQNLSLLERDQYILAARKKGVSVRQLNRLTGTPRGIIERILKNGKKHDTGTLLMEKEPSPKAES